METYTVKETDIVYGTSVDFGTRQVSQDIHIVQYDSSQPIIAVKLYKNSEKFTLPVGYEANIRWGKKDRTFVYKAALGCNVDRTTLYFVVDVQMTLLYGNVQPIIELTCNGAVVGSSSIPVVIDHNPIQIGDIESQSDYPAIIERISSAESKAINAETNAAEAKEIAELAAKINLENDSSVGSVKTKNADNTVSREYSIALGKSNKVSANYAAAFGQLINNQINYSLSVGYNYTNNYSSSLFTVGYNNKLCYVVTSTEATYNVPVVFNGDVDISSAYHLNVDTINSKATGNSILRMYYDTDKIYKVLVGSVARSVTLLGSSERPYYANDGDGFTSRPLALYSDITSLDSKLNSEVAALDSRVSALEEKVKDLEWADIQMSVAAGFGPNDFPAYDKDLGQNGTVLQSEWTRQDSSTSETTTYTMDWNAACHETKAEQETNSIAILDDEWSIDNSTYTTSATEESKYNTDIGSEHTHTANAMYLESQYTLPFTCQFDAPEALLVVKEGKTLPAGTYYLKWHCSDGVSNDVYLSFTLSSDVAAGHQLRLGNTSWSDAMIGNTVKEYADGKSGTVIQTSSAMVEGQTGAYLGTVWGNTTYGTDGAMNDYLAGEVNNGVTHYLNHGDSIKLGYNRWSKSGLRQYLNAEGFDWWKPLHTFDVAPSYKNCRGFLSGLDESVRKVIVPVRRWQRRNHVSDNGSYEYTYDKVFLHVPYERYCQTDDNGSKEGNCKRWPYYKALLDTWSTEHSTSLSQFGLWTIYDILKRYSISSKSSSQHFWSSSATRTSGCHVWIVNSDGYVYNSHACTASFACCPAFVISK